MNNENDINEILVKDKEQIIEGIKEDVLNFLENETMYKGAFYAIYTKAFNNYVVSCIKDFLLDSFYLSTVDVYAIDEDELRILTDDYYFNKMNYIDKTDYTEAIIYEI